MNWISMTEGAQFSVNGASGQAMVSLKPGSNLIIVKAWDTYGGTAEKTVTLIYRSDMKTALFVSSPPNNAVVEKPEISVSGTVTPGALVTINNFEAIVSGSGSFSYILNLPDEPGEYTVQIVAEINGEETAVERMVVYQPAKTPLTLTITSPANGQKITNRIINVSGKTGSQATLTVNNMPVRVSPTGAFTADITLTENDIGQYSLEFVAVDEGEDVSKTIEVQVDNESPQVNTSIPDIQARGQLSGATRDGRLTITALDRTPDDEIVLSFVNNSTRDEYTLGSGENQMFDLEEGKNEFSAYAHDLAGNQSNTIQGEVYYLPGPLSIKFIEPSGSPHVIRGLPPIPGGVDNPMLELSLEIDDGIGNVPEAIKYCRVRGNGQDILLRDNKNYLFTGEVELTANQTSVFTITVEDLAGTVQTTTLTVQFSR
jgi:hypothetical protein